MYTPQLTDQNIRLLKRVSWAAMRPMSEILNQMVLTVADKIDKNKVCAACSDKSYCKMCYFRRQT